MAGLAGLKCYGKVNHGTTWENAASHSEATASRTITRDLYSVRQIRTKGTFHMSHSPLARLKLLSGILLFASFASAQSPLAAKLQAVMSRPEFAHSNFGIEFFDVQTGQVIYSLNADKMFVPASTTKLPTEGSVLAKLGADFRFHTFVYRTGPIDKHGTLKGDVVLVASGDPNLSNRIQPDGTLAFVDHDHTYQGPALPGDPLMVLREMAKAIAAKGIHTIEGNVYIDTSLMPDDGREGGTGVVMSSIIVNDNVVDLTGKPGAKVGDPVAVTISPETAYIHFVNKLVTGAADSKPSLDTSDPTPRPDGSIEVTLNGSIPLGAETQTGAYPVPSPTQFATVTLRECVTAAGIHIKPGKSAASPDFAAFKKYYTPDNVLAEHTSPPISEDVKITLKVSHNLHASMGPYLLGLYAAKAAKDVLNAGFKMENEFLKSANLDLSGASQGDGAGGDWADLFSPDFMCHYLAYWKTRSDFAMLFAGLPILGKDGTLAKIQVSSPAAGHVFAKTGTFGSEDRLNARQMLNGKGLAGYVITKSNRTIAFAAYVNHTALPNDPDAAQNVAGQALGEIAAAAYETLP
jgi:D-alanyl-D-alanine carboxypeptidase/D-alanyl-D-alanine-endopeptidase (penicillin-binding protein 4)